MMGLIGATEVNMKGVITGWSVERYVCPSCNRKGLFWGMFGSYEHRWQCMYRNCEKRFPKAQDVIDANPILLAEKPKWKHYKNISQK